MPQPLRDLALAVRLLLRRPGSSFAVVAMLAVALAGNVTMFALADSLFLRPLPFAAADRLVALDERAPKWNLESVSISYGDFALWREKTSTFEAMAVWDEAAFNLTSAGSAERVDAARATHDLLGVLGVRPALGRGFTAEEDAPGGPKVALLGDSLWRRLFDGDPAALGRSIRLDGEPYEVIGVLPASLRFPREVQLWVPLAESPEGNYGSYSYAGVGRLRPGITPARAKEDLDSIHAALIERFPYKEAVSAVVDPFRESYARERRATMRSLFAAVVLVLLVACADAAAIALARGTLRAREMGVRTALGAGRWRIVSQLLAESLVLATLAGAAGLGLAALALRGLQGALADSLPFWVSFAIDAKTVAFGAALVLGTALLCGLAPALQTVRVDVSEALRATDVRGGAARGRRTLDALVVVEIALAQLLVVAAGLIFLSQRQVLAVEPGFRAEGVLTFGVSLPEHDYPDHAGRLAFWQRTVERLRSLPGVDGVAGATHLPLHGHTGSFFVAEGAAQGDPDASRPVILTRRITGDYFPTLGIPLVAGGAFSPTAASAEVVVNETFARHFWPGTDPVGKRVRFDGDEEEWLTVVGVARDVRHYGLDREVRPGVYLPIRPDYVTETLGLALHTTLPPESLAEPVRAAMRELDPALPLFRVGTLEARLSESLALRRLTARFFSLFAAVGLFLAAAGAYGVLAFAVARRRREIAIRMAIGARAAQVVREVLRSGLRLAVLGVALGLGAALLAGGFLRSLLFGVEARDLRVFLVAPAILLAVALAAAFGPARRASKLQAMAVLREE